MDWQKYFEMMIDWKKLPAYRAEPRIDSFIGFFLPEIASEFLKDEIVGVIPELPIRLGTVHQKHENTNYANKSYKVDFYLLGKSGINYFVEFKTDSKSRRPEQDDYLKKAQNEIGMEKIVDGIKKIKLVSSYKKKYNHLINKLIQLKVLNENEKFIGQDKIKVVYVQPNNKKSDESCIDFQWIHNWLKSKNEIDSFESNFANSLKEWAKD